MLLSICAVDKCLRGAGIYADCVSVLLKTVWAITNDSVCDLSIFSKTGNSLCKSLLEYVERNPAMEAPQTHQKCIMCWDKERCNWRAICEECTVKMCLLYSCAVGKSLNRKFKSLTMKDLAFGCSTVNPPNDPPLSLWWSANMKLSKDISHGMVVQSLLPICPELVQLREIAQHFFAQTSESALPGVTFFRHALQRNKDELLKAMESAEVVVSSRLLAATSQFESSVKAPSRT